jgi:hypothetical protein
VFPAGLVAGLVAGLDCGDGGLDGGDGGLDGGDGCRGRYGERVTDQPDDPPRQDGALTGKGPHAEGADIEGIDHAPATPAARVAGLLVAVQGVVVLAAAVFYLVEAVVSDATSVRNVAMGALLFLLMGAGLLLVARDLVRRRRWARAPAVTWEVICLPVAYGLVQSGRWYVGLPVAVVAAVVLAAVLSSHPAD